MSELVVQSVGLDLTFPTNDGPVHALKGVNLDIKKGEFVSFIGPSGCGKTTFLRVMADLEQPTGGEITVNGVSPAQARAMLGPDKILGLSCETPQAVEAANPLLVDYLGLGPVFGTATKTDHAQPIGFDGLARLVALSPVPTVAIGGLKSIHTSDVRDSGADGMAVVSAICGQADPYAAAQAFALNRSERST